MFEVAKREWHKRMVTLIKRDGRTDLDISYKGFITNKDEKLWKYRDAVKEDLINDCEEYLHVYKRKRALDIDMLTEQLVLAKTNADLVIIDHLHYFDFVTANEHQELTQILKKIRELIVQSRVAIVLISHLRKKTKDRFLPENEDFHGSSNIPKQADTCIIVSKFSPAKEEEQVVNQQVKTIYLPHSYTNNKIKAWNALHLYWG